VLRNTIHGVLGDTILKDVVLARCQDAPCYHAETVDCGSSGQLTQPAQVCSQPVEDAPTVELDLSQGTVLRQASGEIATGQVSIGVTPVPRDALRAPEVGTFGVTQAPQYVSGDPAPATGFILEPEGVTFENPDGTPKPQHVVFGNVPFGEFLTPGAALERVSYEGDAISATVGADGRSLEAQVSKLARYDLLVRLDVEAEGAKLSAEYVQGAGKLARLAVNVTLDSVLYRTPPGAAPGAAFLARGEAEEAKERRYHPSDQVGR
jgi:hypothetical protein